MLDPTKQHHKALPQFKDLIDTVKDTKGIFEANKTLCLERLYAALAFYRRGSSNG